MIGCFYAYCPAAIENVVLHSARGSVNIVVDEYINIVHSFGERKSFYTRYS